MRRLIWIYAVYKSLLLSPVVVKGCECDDNIYSINGRGVFGDHSGIFLVIAPYKHLLWVLIKSFYRAVSNEYQQLILYAEMGANIYSSLSLTTSSDNSATEILMIFSYISQKTYYDI